MRLEADEAQLTASDQLRVPAIVHRLDLPPPGSSSRFLLYTTGHGLFRWDARGDLPVYKLDRLPDGRTASEPAVRQVAWHPTRDLILCHARTTWWWSACLSGAARGSGASNT